jgi:hypothetical protein
MNEQFQQEMNEKFDEFRQEMNDTIIALRQEINENNATLRRIKNDVREIRNNLNSLSIQTIRNTNRNLIGITESIVPLRNHQGQLPPHDVFPQYPSDVLTMEEQDVNTLLDFYGIIPETRRENLDTKRRLLCHHLGLTCM